MTNGDLIGIFVMSPELAFVTRTEPSWLHETMCSASSHQDAQYTFFE